MRDKESEEIETIGYNRYFETMAFRGYENSGYIEADIHNQIQFDSEWAISDCEHDADGRANDMHENVVQEIMKKLPMGIVE
jgi:hypothetical protein